MSSSRRPIASAPEAEAAPRAIVLHGLWMRGLALSALVHRLRRAGLRADSFDFASVNAPMEATVARLRHRMLEADGPVHLVGHSLGGLLALRACQLRDDLPPGRIVCLGSPLAGSAVARRFEDWGVGMLLGHSRELLEGGIRSWLGPREVGMIAGTVPLGLGAWLAGSIGDHDGTVSVAETRVPGLADHCCVAASHTGLLFSVVAVNQVVQFLHDGHFDHGGATPG